VTEFGGELLLIEVVIMPGKGNLRVTGKLGEVMQESAQAALSYIRTRRGADGAGQGLLPEAGHPHPRAGGATPKDGPSAGITMATALASALLRLPARNDLAMTGRSRCAGACCHRRGEGEASGRPPGRIKTVVLPLENEKDLAEVPAKIKKHLEIHFVSHMDEVMALAIDLPKDRKAKPAEEGPRRRSRRRAARRKGTSSPTNPLRCGRRRPPRDVRPPPSQQFGERQEAAPFPPEGSRRRVVSAKVNTASRPERSSTRRSGRRRTPATAAGSSGRPDDGPRSQCSSAAENSFPTGPSVPIVR